MLLARGLASQHRGFPAGTRRCSGPRGRGGVGVMEPGRWSQLDRPKGIFSPLPQQNFPIFFNFIFQFATIFAGKKMPKLPPKTFFFSAKLIFGGWRGEEVRAVLGRMLARAGPTLRGLRGFSLSSSPPLRVGGENGPEKNTDQPNTGSAEPAGRSCLGTMWGRGGWGATRPRREAKQLRSHGCRILRSRRGFGEPGGGFGAVSRDPGCSILSPSLLCR